MWFVSVRVVRGKISRHYPFFIERTITKARDERRAAARIRTPQSTQAPGESNAVLRLSVTVTRRAKLTFWYAHKASSDEEGSFSIDETHKAAFTGNINWSKQEYMLEAGSHDLRWNKNGHYSSEDINAWSYLSLDDILIIYTE
jgi:hypothetical protein